MEAKTGSKFPRWLLWLALLLVMLLGFLAAFRTLQARVQALVNPLEQANRALSTQVADLLHPTPTILPDPVTIIHEVRAVARLETIQYSVEKVITAEVNQGLFEMFVGDRLLFVAHGVVTAGIDLARIQPEDLWLQDGVLHVRLPQAEVLVAALDNEQSYVYDRDTGFLTRGNTDLETAARQAAEQAIIDAALEDGILEQARINAEIFLEKFFQALGYAQVVFVQP
jgi:hypothetical protein